jgi:hypothetical protein
LSIVLLVVSVHASVIANVKMKREVRPFRMEKTGPSEI